MHIIAALRTVAIAVALAIAGHGTIAAAQSGDTAVASAEQAAIGYWGQPPCGTPQIEPTSFADWAEEGFAYPSTCRIELSASVIRAATRGPRQYFELCRVVAHEWGHVVLGEDYFAASNPADPAHSPDIGNLMYAALDTTTPQCLASLPTTELVGPRTYHDRVKVRHDECLISGRAVGYAPRVLRRNFEAWPCVVTNPVSQAPTPEPNARVRELLASLAATG